jgi:hypothetical protein
MLVTIQEVNTNYVKKGNGGYNVAEVKHTSNGKESVKKIFSFANPAVYDAVKAAVPGGSYEIEVKKNGEYWDWVAVKEAAGAAAAATKPAVTGGKVTGSTYETADERKIKQMYIIKQSSISNAIELLSVGQKTPPDVAQVLTTAQLFVDFVYGNDAGDILSQPNDLGLYNDDLPN